jgi:hypothetical protein
MPEDEIYEPSPEEIAAINEGLTQFDSGQWIINEEANKRAKELLENYSRRSPKRLN